MTSQHWPAPQVVTIAQGKIPIVNTSAEPVILTSHKVNSIKVTSTEIVDWSSPSYAALSAITTPPKFTPMPDSETIDTITIGDTTEEIRDLITADHTNVVLTGPHNKDRRLEKSTWLATITASKESC